MELTITGPIETIADITPKYIRFSGFAEELSVGTVRISPAPDHDFSILDIKMQTGKDVKVDFKVASLETKAWDLTVTNLKTTPGRYMDVIKVLTDNLLMEKIEIRVYGDIKNKPKSAQ